MIDDGMYRMFSLLLRQSAFANSYRELEIDYMKMHRNWAYFLGLTLIFSSYVYLTVMKYSMSIVTDIER